MLDIRVIKFDREYVDIHINVDGVQHESRLLNKDSIEHAQLLSTLERAIETMREHKTGEWI